MLERTCLICRAKGRKWDLVRIAAKGRDIVIDVEQRAPGRGVYVHGSAECVSRIAQPGRLEKALRLTAGSLDPRQVRDVVEELSRRVITGASADKVANRPGDSRAVGGNRGEPGSRGSGKGRVRL